MERLGTLPVYDDPDRKGPTLGRVVFYLLLLALIAALVAGLGSRVVS